MTTGTPTQRPALLLLCMAQFMLVLDFAIVNVALPTIKHDLAFTTGQLPWVVGAYALFFGGFLLIGVRAGDIFGRKRIFLIGLVAFTAASLVGGFATAPIVLIAARAVQGLAAAVVSPAVLALIAAGYEEGSARTSAMGWYGAVSSAGFTGGVLFGGILTGTLGWRAVMFVNVPVGIALIARAASRLVDDRVTGPRPRVDLPGAVLITASMCSIIYALTVASDQGWRAAQVTWLLAAGAVLLIAFVIVQTRTQTPLVPLGIFRNRSVTAGNGIAFLSGGVMAISTFFLTLYMQQLLHYSAIVSGFAFFPQAFIVVLASLPVVKLTERVGAKSVLAVGGVLLAVGSIALSLAPADGHFLPHILPWGLLLGLGVTVMMITTAVAATSGVPRHLAGLASGLYTSSRQMGVGLCLAVAVAAAGLGRGTDPIGSLHVGFQISAGLSVAIVVLAVAVLPRSRAAQPQAVGTEQAVRAAEPVEAPAQ